MTVMEPGTSTLLMPEERVLPTLEHDGRRRWIYPHISTGYYFHLRRILGFSLIAFFVTLPWLRINGKPYFLIDVITREVTVLGYTFLPTDSLLLAFFMMSLFVSVFLLTALLGRVWCGWGCPQTVYMEFVYRPIERFFCGTIGRGGKPSAKLLPVYKVFMYACYLVISFLLANVFLSYFVGTDRLVKWVQLSPINHPAPFMTMAIVTIAMMFDFCFFREQLCLIACPYGRFQSVLLDRNSLIVSYDKLRGEPRGHTKKVLPVVTVDELQRTTSQTKQLGDCIDCGACVRTCPTGIDIRDGLQLECIHCTQCIDACDEIMVKIGKPTGLVKYSCQEAIDGKPFRMLRPRVVIYPLILAVLITLMAVTFVNKHTFEVTLMRNFGLPYTKSEQGLIRNSIRMKIVNRQELETIVQLKILEPHKGIMIDESDCQFKLTAKESMNSAIMVEADHKLFKQGLCLLKLEFSNSQGDTYQEEIQLIGPEN